MPVARYWDGAAWQDLAVGAPAPVRVTALPAGAVDGQEVYYVADATNGVLWHLRYNAGSGSAYKWEYVGGPPLTAEVATIQTTNSNAYADLATVGPQLTLPLTGDYDFAFGAKVEGQVQNRARISPKLGASAAADSSSATIGVGNPAGQGQGSSISRHLRLTGRPAAEAVRLQYRVDIGGNTADFEFRWLRVTPVRVA